VQLVGRDITERKQTLQRELELALEKERTQLLSTFIQNATHEFKTPLAVIGTSSFLMARMDEREKRQQKLNIVNEQVQRIAKLIDKLLTMTKLNTISPTDLEMVAVDMGVAAEMADQMVLSRHSEGGQLVWQIPAHVPPVWGVKESLVEAIAQILDNAYHFTPCSGTITVSLGHTDSELWLKVEDTGAGIDAEDFPHLFEVFWRLDVAHTTPGFGLGLPIAQRIVQLHGGRIEIARSVGVGTAVTLWLPLAPIG
jgi:signal transduction histidine kinase